MFFKSAREEFMQTLAQPHLWALLSWYDIKQRYRRSVLGPLWLTISTAILIGTLGLLWSTLFKTNLREYLPFFATGSVVWTFFSTQLNEAATGYTQFENLIKQIRLPYPSYILRLVCRNLIIFAHNFVIVIFVISVIGTGWSWTALIALPGLLLFSAAAFFASQIVAIICTRFRDMVPVVQNLVTVVYFLSPIMWQPKSLPARQQWVVELNPLSYLLDIVRMPLLGQIPSVLTWGVSVALAAVLGLLSHALFKRYRNRISYWL
jgi:lipopolysaccharide transport system permease protein